MTRKWIYKELADLRFAVNRKVAERRGIMRKVESNLEFYTPERLKACMAFTDGLRVMGLSDDAGMKLGHGNRLPQSLQDQYWLAFDCLYESDEGNEPEEDEISLPRPAPSLDERHPRWRLDNWVCKCGAHQTLWYKTHLRNKDRFQIYCASCRTLAGWGTKQEFETVVHSGEGKMLILKHPLDRDLYTPQLLCKPVAKTSPTLIRAKQTQPSVRAK